MVSPPRFLVLLCTHNGERFLQAQLNSLQRQELPIDAIEVHDWASIDGTSSLLRSFAAKGSDTMPLRLVQHAQAPGPAASFLQAIEDTLQRRDDFDYLLLCDQDDVWRPDKTRHFAAAIARSEPRPDLVFSDVELIDAQGQLLAPSYLEDGGAIGHRPNLRRRCSLFVNTVAGMSMGVSRSFLLRHRGAWALRGWLMHDWALCQVAHLSAAQVSYIPHSLVSYRQHTGNLLGGQQAHAVREPLRRAWRQGRAHVHAVYRQYLACTRQVLATPGRELPVKLRGWQVAVMVIHARPFNWAKTLKVALGYWLWWPGAATADPATDRS